MDHNHSQPNVGEVTTAQGETLDAAPLSRLIGAAHAGCQPCQRERTRDLLRDDRTELVTHLAGVAYLGMRREGVSSVAETVGIRVAAPTRTVLESFDLDDPAGAERQVAQMRASDRRAIVDDMLDMFVGMIELRRAVKLQQADRRRRVALRRSRGACDPPRREGDAE